MCGCGAKMAPTGEKLIFYLGKGGREAVSEDQGAYNHGIENTLVGVGWEGSVQCWMVPEGSKGIYWEGTTSAPTCARQELR